MQLNKLHTTPMTTTQPSSYTWMKAKVWISPLNTANTGSVRGGEGGGGGSTLYSKMVCMWAPKFSHVPFKHECFLPEDEMTEASLTPSSSSVIVQCNTDSSKEPAITEELCT